MKPPRPLALVSEWSDEGGLTTVRVFGCDPEPVAFAPFPHSLFSGCVAVCQDLRRFITRLNGRPYFGVGVAWLSRRTNIGVAHLKIPRVPILPEKRRMKRGYVMIRNHKFNIAPNLLDHNFTADQPNQKPVGDIT